VFLDVQLWKKPQVTVAFTIETIGLLGKKKWGLGVNKIFEWANRWHNLQKEPNYIPKFIPLGGQVVDIDAADIIVELNGNNNESLYHIPSSCIVAIVHIVESSM
jgi:hypothetical protein